MIRQMGKEFYKLMVLRCGYVFIITFIIMNIYHIDNNNTVIKNSFTKDKEEKLLEYFDKYGHVYDKARDDEVEELYIKSKSPTTDDPEIKKYQSVIRYYYKCFLIGRNNKFTDRIEDTRGYEVLLDEYGGINVWILLFTLILTALVFGVDKGNGQEAIVKSTRYGNKIVILSKLGLISLLIIGFEAVRFVCSYLSVAKQFSLSDMGIPVQNISSLQEVDFSLSVGTAIAFCVVAEAIGLIMANLVCAFLVTYANKAAAGFFMGFALSYVPVFMLNADKFYRKLPLPGAYLAPYNFVDKLYSFELQYIVTIIIVIALYVGVYIAYTGKRRIHRWQNLN